MTNSHGLQERIANRHDWLESNAPAMAEKPLIDADLVLERISDVRGTGWIEERLEYRPPIHWMALVFVGAFWLALGAAAVVAVKVLL